MPKSYYFGHQKELETITLYFSNAEVQCDLQEISDYTLKLKAPSLKSFIRASTAMEDQELRLSGLAVFPELANACQPLADVSKAKIQVNKIAVITLEIRPDGLGCPFQGLVEHAQNAGYSMVIFLDYFLPGRVEKVTQLQDNLLIPVLSGDGCHLTNNRSAETIDVSDLKDLDRTDIEITVSIMQPTDDLKKMQQYLRRLYFWFLLGPIITLEWLRRRKNLYCTSGLVSKETRVESGLNRAADHEATQGETKPLLPYSNVPRNGHSRPIAIRRVLSYLRVSKLGCGYVILVVVALPVGISSGGWSFFRFDQNEIQQKSFWDDLIISHYVYNIVDMDEAATFFDFFLPMCWPPLQVFCFFLYSRFTCKTTWTIATNFSKLIRSDWFASNMYLFVLGVVVPYCSSSIFEDVVVYFAAYNMVCTICNLLFIIVLDKHKFVTRYVFYISVCMIGAYIESDIVAVFYFMMNSKGSLANLKLTALRTVAIGLTLSLSFSSSMHIVRKLTKPQESLLEGLGEK